jgi:hypothetical protein
MLPAMMKAYLVFVVTLPCRLMADALLGTINIDFPLRLEHNSCSTATPDVTLDCRDRNEKVQIE